MSFYDHIIELKSEAADKFAAIYDRDTPQNGYTEFDNRLSHIIDLITQIVARNNENPAAYLNQFVAWHALCGSSPINLDKLRHDDLTDAASTNGELTQLSSIERMLISITDGTHPQFPEIGFAKERVATRTEITHSIKDSKDGLEIYAYKPDGSLAVVEIPLKNFRAYCPVPDNLCVRFHLPLPDPSNNPEDGVRRGALIIDTPKDGTHIAFVPYSPLDFLSKISWFYDGRPDEVPAPHQGTNKLVRHCQINNPSLIRRAPLTLEEALQFRSIFDTAAPTLPTREDINIVSLDAWRKEKQTTPRR